MTTYVKVSGKWQSDVPPAPTHNAATGGIQTDYTYNGTKYRSHLFKYTGAVQQLQVTASVFPFWVLVVAGGTAGGNDFSQYGGNGGGVNSFTYQIPLGSHDLTVGQGGQQIQNPPDPGQPSSAFGQTAAANTGAAGGTPYGSSGPGQGNPGGEGQHWPYLDGTDQVFGSGGGGGGGINGSPGPSGPGTYGCGGRGSNWSMAGWGGEPGKDGCVVVTYQIEPAPFNEAVGGDVTEYTEGDKKYRQHRFDADGPFTVISGPAPFEVLVVGGGGNGGPASEPEQHAGNGGGGGGGSLKAMPLTDGIHDITIPGQGGTNTFTNGTSTITATGGGDGTPGVGSGGDQNFTGGSGGGGAGRGNNPGGTGQDGFPIWGLTLGAGGGGGASQVSQPPQSISGGPGGKGGGGKGCDSFSENGYSGLSTCGGGGVGIYWTVTSGTAGYGGRGATLIRYEVQA